jgi:STE24 endopeptidase
VRLPILLAAALAALGLLLWQARLPPAVPAPPPQSAFTQRQIERARDYREPLYRLELAQLATQVAVALLLAWRGGARLAAGPRPWVRATTAAFGVAALVAASALPFLYEAHRRAQHAGIDLRSDAAWARDALLGVLTTALAVALVYGLAFLLLRRTRRPWLAAGLAAWALVAGFVALQPLVVDPLFMHTRDLPPGRLPGLVDGLERRLGAYPASVRISDAGRRTRAENAFVDGLGPTVRVVVDDTALREGRAELRALVAHELAHVARRHTLKGVLWFGVLALPALALAGAAAERVARRRYADGVRDPRATAIVLAAVVVAATLLLPLENLISRRYEAEADWVALQATGDGRGMEQLQRHLALSSLANPDPPRWAVLLLFDHPPVMERIGVARSVDRGGG